MSLIKVGLLYVLPGALVLGAFFGGHMLITPERDRLADPNETVVLVEPEEEPTAKSEGASDSAVASLLGPPQYQYFPYRTTLVGNISDTDQLFSFEVAVAVYDTHMSANSSMDVLAELELQLTPMILDLTVGMKAETLLSQDGREALKLRIKDMLNDTLAKWGHEPFIRSVEITSFVVT